MNTGLQQGTVGFSFPYVHGLWKPSPPPTGELWQPDPRLNEETRENLKRAVRMLAEGHLALPQVGESFESLDSMLERFWSFGFAQGLPFTLFDLVLGVHCAQRWTTNCPSQYTFSYMTNGDGTITYTLTSINHIHNHQSFANPFQMPQTYRPRVLTGCFDCFGNPIEHCDQSQEPDLASMPREQYAEFAKAINDLNTTFGLMILKLEDKISVWVNRIECLNLALERDIRRSRAASAPSAHCVIDDLSYPLMAVNSAPMETGAGEMAENLDS
ncbi:hypothetical protein MPH_13894 [Macrophomina phaseolina MS6]|uniref:Uncharacterized protein n=1 Tax=Macrophomina phaseolina (strain MS6) TaxID=1126212 RepID=K2QH90_MACPH|nr:hypothetical protein MPH_13894 [Macrophomina phaseolina MS6]